jgi:hypothetical protein
MRLRNVDLVVICAAIILCAVVYSAIISKNSFGYDESDYMYASSKGLLAHYIDRNTIPFSQFLRFGSRQGLAENNGMFLSEIARESDDIAFYRHYHGPLLFYSLIIWRYFVGDSEYSIRWIVTVFMLATIAAIYIGCVCLLRENARLSAIIASALFVTSPVNMVTAGSQLSTHTVYTLVVTVVLCFMARFIQTGNFKFWYYAVGATALSFMATEYSPLLAITIVACAIVERRRLFPSWSGREYARLLAASALIFVAVIFILWPGAWLKLTLVRNYLVMAYLAMAREGEFGTLPFWQAWLHRFLASPIQYLILLAAAAVALRELKERHWYLPFLIYPACLIVTTLQITALDDRYVSSMLPSLSILGAITFTRYWREWAGTTQVLAIAVLTTVLLAQSVIHFASLRAARQQATSLDEVVGFFRATCLACKTLLVSRTFFPTLQYYFPDKDVVSYSRGYDNSVGTIVGKLRVRQFDGVVYHGTEHRLLEERLQSYFQVKRQTITRVGSDKQQVVFYRLYPKRTLSSLATQERRAL